MNARSSPSRVSGNVHREVTVGGHRFVLTNPDRVRKASDEEKVIIAKRLDMYEAMIVSVSRLPEKFQDRALAIFIEKVVCGMASAAEWDSYYKSWWNLAFDLWCALDQKQKLDDEGNERTLLEGVYWAYDLLNELSESSSKVEFDNLKLAIR